MLATEAETDCFNPRPRMGGDTLSSRRDLCNLMFQSTPPHGSKRSIYKYLARLCVSIHAPAWGATAD